MDDKDYLYEAVDRWWGSRCPDYDPDCHCCRAWLQYDASVPPRKDKGFVSGMTEEQLSRCLPPKPKGN